MMSTLLLQEILQIILTKINTLSEDECPAKLWFFKQDLDKLLECLGIPEKIVNKEQFAVVWMEFC